MKEQPDILESVISNHKSKPGELDYLVVALMDDRKKDIHDCINKMYPDNSAFRSKSNQKPTVISDILKELDSSKLSPRRIDGWIKSINNELKNNTQIRETADKAKILAYFTGALTVFKSTFQPTFQTLLPALFSASQPSPSQIYTRSRRSQPEINPQDYKDIRDHLEYIRDLITLMNPPTVSNNPAKPG